jgi:uncharacterized circularly permuted ATP-grasp superfamily protein
VPSSPDPAGPGTFWQGICHAGLVGQNPPGSLLNAQYDSSIFFHEMFESGKNAFRPHYRRLAQRLLALNLFLDDIYHGQRGLEDNLRGPSGASSMIENRAEASRSLKAIIPPQSGYKLH